MNATHLGGIQAACAIAGEDKPFVPAQAKIQGSTLIVSAAGVAAPEAVRYGYPCQGGSRRGCGTVYLRR